MAKLAFRQIDDIIKKARRDDETFRFDTGEDRVEITVKQWLSVEEITGFVDTVADALFIGGNYNPALRQIVFFKALLAYFTNVKTEGLNNDRLIGLFYIVGPQIEKRIDANLLSMLHDAVDMRIDWTLKCSLSVQQRRLDEAIAELNAEKEMITERMEALIAVFERMASEAEGFNKEELMKDIKKIANKSELGIAQAVLYSQSEGADDNEPAERA